MSRGSGNGGLEQNNDYGIERRNFLGIIAGLGGYAYLDQDDNGKIDGSPFASISSFLNGEEDETRVAGFNGMYAQNSTSPRQNTGNQSTPNETDPVPTPNETDPEPVPNETDPEPVPNETDPEPVPNETDPEPTPPELDRACDRLYLQKEEDSVNGHGDGTVIGLDIADREYRIFTAEEFPENEDLTGLYDEIVESRGRDDLPADLGEGVRTTRSEVFDYSIDAYDDMSDEEEWDTIFDDNDESNCQI